MSFSQPPLGGEITAHFTHGKVEAQRVPWLSCVSQLPPDWRLLIHGLVLLQPGSHEPLGSDWLCGTEQRENSFLSFYRGCGHPKSGSFARKGL